VRTVSEPGQVSWLLLHPSDLCMDFSEKDIRVSLLWHLGFISISKCNMIPDYPNSCCEWIVGPDDMPAHIKSSMFGCSVSYVFSS
jgi:hypothetical protein